MNKPLSMPRQAFVQYIADSGSDTYNNAAQSYKKAYPKCNGGWNRLGARLMTMDVVRQAISKYKAKITATMDWNRQCNMKALAEQLAAVNAILEAQPLNVAALGAKTAIIRECNASSNQHKATYITEAMPDQPTGTEAEATEAAAREYKLRLAGSTQASQPAEGDNSAEVA